MSGAMLELTEERRRSLNELITTWLGTRQPHVEFVDGPVEVREVEVLQAGRPAVLDVIAQVDGRLCHAVFGVRRLGDVVQFLGNSEEPALGLFEDDDGLGMVVDALRDVELAPVVLAAVTGDSEVGTGVAPVSDGDEGVVLAFADHCSLTVFPWLTEGVHPGIELLVALDEAGFNHLAAPRALWRRGGRDLGVVQEMLAGSAGGWALALTSLRDLYASGGTPEEAGGDFGSEARLLGTMTARMHLALDRSFGRRTESVTAWVDEVAEFVGAADPELLEAEGVQEAFGTLRAADLSGPVIHTHGDFNLGRTARTDQGWVLADCMPGGVPPGFETVRWRSPLADVSDMLWSLHHVASVAATERDPTGRSGLSALARSWEARNRRAFLSGYLAAPGIGGLVPTDREVVRRLAAVFELTRAASRIRSAAG